MRSLATILVISAVALAATGCGPIQGYPGPERPDTETALVEPDGEEDITVQVNEYEFHYRGIRLLPGRYTFRVLYTYQDEPFDCRVSEEFDDYGYRNCLREQDKDIRKNRSYVRDCYRDDYWNRYEECQVPYFDSQCSITAKVAAGSQYNMSFGLRGKSGAPELREAIANKIVEVGKCQKPSSRTELERKSL